MERRKSREGRVLKDGEYQRPNGTFEYRWSEHGRRYSIYGKTLDILREKEKKVNAERNMGLLADARMLTVNDVYSCWVQLKRGLKGNTFQNYQYMYRQFVWNDLGQKKLYGLKRSDIRRFYNRLADERGLKVTTIDGIHTVLHQVLDLAVEDEYIQKNPSDHALRELRQTSYEEDNQKKALTVDEQLLLMRFLEENSKYNRWKPLVTTMIEGGLRVGEQQAFVGKILISRKALSA